MLGIQVMIHILQMHDITHLLNLRQMAKMSSQGLNKWQNVLMSKWQNGRKKW
ncbi:hypothetical protein Syun_006003 [Stephania yunnanensis]|uniref:Uncharacterized protein n=1 Tax=Stephania yunnanensis TaxID=152371 RepID=A0AAP0KXH8_9MAGN